MRVHSELILLFAGDAVFFGDVLAGDAHVVVVVNVPEAIVHHGVDDGGVAEPITLTRLRQKIGGVGHRLHAAGEDDGTVAGLYRLRRESDGFQPGATDLVDCHGTYLGGETTEDCGLTRGVLTEPRWEDVAHDALIDLLGIEGGALHGLAHNDCAELRRGEIGETALKFSDRSAASRNDDNLVETSHK